MSEETGHRAAIQKLKELTHGIRVAMLTTAAPDGSLYSRPMATQELEDDGTLWFFTNSNSPKIAEIQADAHVNVGYVQPNDNLFVSVAGRATLLKDSARVKELWNPAYKAWFPGGPDDPELALLKVSVESVEYWDAPSNKMVLLAGMVKAIATGQEYAPGENEKLDLK